jgi:homoserine kinase
MMKFIVKTPATTANLGPGFDALGLALTLWNETSFEAEARPAAGNQIQIAVEGEGQGHLHLDGNNLIARAARRVFEKLGREMPALRVHCINRIPLGSGMGSSAAATLTGLMGANALAGNPLSQEEILRLATEIEGHPDNVAPAQLGGLVVSTLASGKIVARRIEIAPLALTIVKPDFHFPTRVARQALPKRVTMRDAVHNISRAVLVTKALESGDFDLLGAVMQDTLHQPYRLPLIPGASEAMQAAKRAGAAAVALSGAGPSLAAFSSKREPGVGAAMIAAFESTGLTARAFELDISLNGASIA